MILTIFKKDLKLFFLDKRAVLLTFMMPILLISLFAFAFGGAGKSKKPKRIELLVADLDKSDESYSLISNLDSLNGIFLIPKEIISATALVQKGKYIGVLIIENGFQDSITSGSKLPLELKYDASREIEMGMLQSVLMGKLMKNIESKTIKVKMSQYLENNFSGIPESIKEKIYSDIDSDKSDINSMMGDNIQLKITSIIKENSNEGNLGLIQAVAGTAIMMLLFSIAGIGGGLLDEKEGGTLKRLLYSPLSPTDILFGKMAATLIISVLQLTVMFVFSWLVFDLPIFLDIISLILMILTTSFAVSSFGIFLVSIAKSRQQLQGFSTIIIMTMSAIGGSMIPLFIMPEIIQKVAVISVNYWGIQGFFDIFWRKLPLIDILPKMGILIIMGTIMTMISIRLFKKNILKMI